MNYYYIGNTTPMCKKNLNKEFFFKRHLDSSSLEDMSFIYVGKLLKTLSPI